MKKLIFSVLTFALVACGGETSTKEAADETAKSETVNTETTKEDILGTNEPVFLGEEIVREDVIQGGELFSALEKEDTLRDVVVSGKIKSCCQAKGCWMKLDVGAEEDVFVKFKDYGFFVPMDCEGVNSVIQGNFYRMTESVEELQHYAKDAGKSEDEIAMITEPKTTYTFIASGVILTDYKPTRKQQIPSAEEETEMEENDEESEM
jgi:hypothetical protein